jgi:hypothetical protein
MQVPPVHEVVGFLPMLRLAFNLQFSDGFPETVMPQERRVSATFC